MEADQLKRHFLLLQINERAQHARLAMAILVTKAADPYVEYDNVGLLPS